MTVNINEISEQIIFHRKQAGLTQKQLADIAGVGKTVIYVDQIIADMVISLRKQNKKIKLPDAVGTRFFSELENGKPTLHIDKVIGVLENFGFKLLIVEL